MLPDSFFFPESVVIIGASETPGRIGSGLYRNVPGNYDIRMFESAVRYFS